MGRVEDTDYIIILRDMDERETDKLFDHTRRILTNKMETHLRISDHPINPSGRAEYSWVRKRSKSKEPVRMRSSNVARRNTLWLA
ncbi:hypothetical protein UCDDS831_g01015 [Diplodia seriata]|uniref:Uncharacterized protein n=1 Tax=Diplodia seriata TaxID=420778 RepID=A0A0G2EWD8_9PEZI|nr:hypothetical protein UCDDS831_g01015 [Diplodia seriata]